MSESEPSLHHYQIQLTIDLWYSDRQLVQRDSAILQQHLYEAAKAIPKSTNYELDYTFLGPLPISDAYTNHTNERDACPQCFEDEEGHFYRCTECEIERQLFLLHHEDWHTDGL